MKIIFLVAHLQSGGSERTVAYLSSYFAEHNIDVTIISLSDKVFYEINPKVHLKSLFINRKSKNALDRIYLAAKRFLLVRKEVRKGRYDIVFCMLPEMAKYILGCQKKYGFKLITSERINPDLYVGTKTLETKKKIFAKSDGIVFQTLRARDFYPEHIRKKGVVIHNAIGNPLVYDAPKVLKRQKKICAIGRLSEQKDYLTLFEAFRRVLNKCPGYTLEIFGEGPDREALQKETSRLGIEKHVLFRGAQKDAIMQASDAACYVLSSKYEGMPNALMEAMAVGLPCVSTDCPNGPAELIENGKNGLLVPVGDSEKLAEAILRMIEDAAFAESCGKNAKKILETHNIDVKAKEYMDYIIKICNGDRA